MSAFEINKGWGSIIFQEIFLSSTWICKAWFPITWYRKIYVESARQIRLIFSSFRIIARFDVM